VTAVFDPETLHEVAARHLGKPLEPMLDAIQSGLAARYPGHVHPTERVWVLNTAGGAMGAFAMLYASLSEYVMFFGTPIGTSGHTGRHHFVDDHVVVLDGEMWQFAAGSTRREVYGPGDRVHLERGVAKGFRVPDRVWMLEYARGAIPLMIPFGLADALISTLDWRTALRTLGVYASHVLRRPGS